MSTHIHIDNVQLDLRGVSPEVARAAAENLGPALHAAIAAQLAGKGATGTLRVDHVAPAPLRVASRPTPDALRTGLAQHVARSIASQLPAQQP